MKITQFLITKLTLLTLTRYLADLKRLKDELNLEARITALKNYIECKISSLDSKFPFVCDKLKLSTSQNMKQLKRIDFLQNDLRSFKRCYNQSVIRNASWKLGLRY